MLSNPETLLTVLPLFIVAITLHELAHALTALWCGDDTAKQQGRITLNPIYHLDIFGTLMLVMAGFGWAKPVPVDVRNLKHPRWQIAAISAAGPLSNLLLAFICAAFLKHASSDFLLDPLRIGLLLNVMLFIFNLLPIPPLDGAGILQAFLPSRAARKMEDLMPYGVVILIALVFLPAGKNFLYTLLETTSTVILNLV